MRVISGKYRGKRVTPPKNFPSRPTTDMAKEGLFNILENRIYWEDLNVLDLFSGTGNISVEFLSRGVKGVLSIDVNPISTRHLAKLKDEFDDDNWTILRRDVFRFLSHHSVKYELIFADPPFELKGVERLPELVFDNDLLKSEGILIIEHGREISFKNHARCTDERNYGGVFFSFFS